MRKGKLESQAMKIQMLDWWSDKTKSYHLENLKNVKLITLWNIQFFKNNSPSNLAVINIDVECPPKGEVDNLVDKAIRIDQHTDLHCQHVNTGFKSTVDITSISNAYNGETLIYHILPESFPSISPTSDMLTLYAELSTLLTVESRPSKWTALLRRDLSS